MNRSRKLKGSLYVFAVHNMHQADGGMLLNKASWNRTKEVVLSLDASQPPRESKCYSQPGKSMMHERMSPNPSRWLRVYAGPQSGYHPIAPGGSRALHWDRPRLAVPPMVQEYDKRRGDRMLRSPTTRRDGSLLHGHRDSYTRPHPKPARTLHSAPGMGKYRPSPLHGFETRLAEGEWRFADI